MVKAAMHNAKVDCGGECTHQCHVDKNTAGKEPVFTLVSDDDFAMAYDAVPASLRACLKTSIAAHHAVYGIAPSMQKTQTERATAGFTVGECQKPVAWTAIVLTETFASGPRLVAALMPALLAGVQNVHIMRVHEQRGQTPWPHALLAALELAGQEQAICVDLANLAAYVTKLAHEMGTGRVLLLGESHGLAACLAHAIAHLPQCTVWAEGHAPSLYIDASCTLDMDRLTWAHPDATILQAHEQAESKNCHTHTQMSAVYTIPTEGMPSMCAPLTLFAGSESMWLYPELSLHYFMQRSVSLGLYLPEDNLEDA